jgi:hypothetical protein
LGVVRLGLDADWDRMENLANLHLLVRQMLGVPMALWGVNAKVFGHQTLRDNVARLDDQRPQQINARLAAAGRAVKARSTVWNTTGLNRCLDVGREWLRRKRERGQPLALAA